MDLGVKNYPDKTSFAQTPTDDKYGCRQYCESTSGCEWFVYYTATYTYTDSTYAGQCHLFNFVPDGNSANGNQFEEPDNGVFSGGANCEPCWLHNIGSINTGTLASYENPRRDNAQECQDDCQSDFISSDKPDCVWWVYLYGFCWKKVNVPTGDEFQVTSRIGAVSGPAFCTTCAI